jgi:hypothetical protein
LRNQYQMVGKNDEIQELAISPTARPGSQLVGVMAMKNAEPMEQAPKSTELVLASDEAGGLEMPSVADQRRRRLVRGAAAFAPVVLTLRSGALAAASCTGAKTVSYTIPKTGPNNGALPPGTVEGDVCVQGLSTCTTSGMSDHKVETPLSVPNYQLVDNKLQCKDFNGQTVAILSSASAGSMGIQVVSRQ